MELTENSQGSVRLAQLGYVPIPELITKASEME